MYHIFPFQLIEKGTNIVLYGAGIAGRNFLLQVQKLNYCNITCIADKNSQKNYICNIKVISPDDLNQYVYDKIVITPIKKETQEEIKKELIMLGIPENKIVSFVSEEIEWDRPKIRFLSQHEEYLWALKTDDYLEKIDPRVLVVSDRIDIVVRYLLFRDYVYKIENREHLSLYTRYVLCRTGGHEAESYYSDKGKNTVQMYVERGKQLCESIIKDGFNAEHFIPLKYENRACDGLHRIAACIAANEKIWVKRYENDFEHAISDVSLEWFKKEGFLFKDCVRILRGFTEIYSGKCGIYVLYATMEDMWQYIEKQIALQFKIVGKVDFDYADNYLAFQNVLRQIYYDKDRSNEWLTRKLDLLMLAPLKYRVIVVSDEKHQIENFFDEIRKLKLCLREKFSADVDQRVPILLHASDSEEEFIHLKKIFLSANNFFWQDKRLKQYYRTAFFRRIDDLNIWCDAMGIDRDDVCVVGSAVLELLGISRSNNLNIIVKTKYRISERINKGELEILEFDYCLSEKGEKICNDIIIDDDEYHMVFADVKFCNMEFVYRYKKIRGQEKDKIDVAKMDAWYDFGKNFDDKKALRKRIEIELRKRIGNLNKIRSGEMTIGMIPIKLNNQRIPGKNLKCFDDGTPLVQFIQKAMLGSKLLDYVYVYCSDERIQDYLLPGIQFMKRPEYLDADQCNCNDIIREFIKSVDAEIYCVSHVTGPFTRSSSIDACIEAVKSNRYDSAFLAKSMREFLWQEKQALNFDVQNFPRTQDLIPIYSETPGAYVFTKETFRKYGRRVGIRPYIHEVDEIESRDIDYPMDFAVANAIYMNILKKDGE